MAPGSGLRSARLPGAGPFSLRLHRSAGDPFRVAPFGRAASDALSRSLPDTALRRGIRWLAFELPELVRR